VVLGYPYWISRFGGDSGVIGQTIPIGARTFTIVGVAAAGFEGIGATRVDLWMPAATASAVHSYIRSDWIGQHGFSWLSLIVRPRPEVTPPQAEQRLGLAHRSSLLGQGDTARASASGASLWPLLIQRGPERDDSTRVAIWLGAVALLVLLLACANVANLLLVRGAARERELAVRAALGGGRGTLIRQLMVESLVLAGVGAALGLGLAWGGIRVLLAMGPEELPRLSTVALDPAVLGFALLAALTAALLFGIVPALRASGVVLADSLRAGTRSAGIGHGHLLRDGVVIAEVALAFVLLVGSGLMIRSFVALQRADPGYDPAGLLTFSLSNLNRPAEARATFVRQLRERLEGLPGVTAVSAANPLPLDGGLSNTRWGTEAALTDPSLFQQANLHIVLPGYFEAMRTRLVEGRTFTEADNIPELRLTVIDTRLAAKAFPEGSPIGKRFLARLNSPEPEWFEVIGVVAHQRHETLAEDGREAMFLSDGFFQFGAANRWVVRTGGDPALLAGAARAAVRELDRSLAVVEIQPMLVFVDRAQAPTRFALTLIGIFAVIAVALAAVGLYGVLATMVRQRTSEIGVRLAFGAERGMIVRLVVGQGLRLCLIGLVVGVAAALALTRVMSSMLVGVGATDPVTFGAMVAVFVVVALVACWVPARAAARLDPTEALRAS
jgi:putative ABC transport system permease protein